MPSVSEHKSKDKYPFSHPLVWINRYGNRDLSMESSVYKEDERYCYGDRDAIVTLHLNAEGIEFLLDQLPHSDGFTDVIEYLRDLAKHKVEQGAWDREVSR